MEVGAPKRVLVCDDERHIVRLIQMKLEREGHIVKWAFDGHEALKLLAASTFDTLLIENKLTDPTTAEVVAQLRLLPGGEAVEVIELQKPS